MTYLPQNTSRTINGMFKKLEMFQAITSNIANANSIAYKRRIPESISFKSVLSEALRDESQGQLKRTDETLDIAIEGDAFFMIDTEAGLTTTRNGRFKLNEKGEIVTLEGKELVIVEKTDKPISLAKETEIEINEEGEIFVAGERYGRVALEIQNNKPVKLHQGYVEGSNVNLINEMAALTMIFRSIEASEKLIGMEASVDRDLIEKYGRNV